MVSSTLPLGTLDKYNNNERISMSKASDFLHNFLSFTTLMPGQYDHLGPGQVVLRMSEDKRKILSELKSEDLQNIRVDAIFGSKEAYEQSRKNIRD